MMNVATIGVDDPAIRLSSEALDERVRVFNGDGQFGLALKELWEVAGDIITRGAELYRRNRAAMVGAADATPLNIVAVGSTAADRNLDPGTMFTQPVNADWVEMVASQGRHFYFSGAPILLLVDYVSRACVQVVDDLRAKLPDDEVRQHRLINTVQRLACIQIEVVMAQVAVIERYLAASERIDAGGRFHENMLATLRQTVGSASGLRVQTVSTASAARGMLDKTSEVAAAAEQSAVAMREAAQTAAGLIRAIDEARGQVEAAASIATRAAGQSAEAVEVSGVLSGHAQAIESILGLIRDIAGQTNLLALNATIEAVALRWSRRR